MSEAKILTETGDTIEVLHVDDEPEFADLTATFLEREDDRFTVVTATSADDGLEIITDRPPDCVVSDYNMPGMDGLEFLQAVREDNPDLPFILFTGKGSETVASDAIAAGVTDYLQKGSGTEQYELLANRIRNAVHARRETRRADRQEQLMRLTEFAGDTGGFELDTETGEMLLTDGFRRLVDLSAQADLSLTEAIDLYHPEDRTDIQQAIDHARQTGEQTHGTWRLQTRNGDERLLDVTFRPTTTDDDTTILRGAIHDITERREHQQELEQIETLFQHAQDSLFLIDVTDEFSIERVNPAWEDTTGLSAEQVRGQTPTELLGEQQGTAIEANYCECVERREPRQYEEQIRFDNKLIQWETRIAPVVVDGTVEYIAGSTRDVTDQKERRQELREERRFITQALDTLDDLFYVVGVDGSLRRWNSRVVDVTGYSEAELDDMQAVELFPEDDRETIADAIQMAVSGETVTVEADLRTADGQRIPYEFTGARLTDENGTTTGIVGTGRDLTERKQRDRRFRALVEESNDVISIVDTDGRFQYQSPSLERILGHDPEETTGEMVWEYIHPDDRETVIDEFQTWVANPDQRGETVEYRARDADGSWRWMEAEGNNQLDNPAVEGYVVNSRDITERKERERELERYKTFVEATGDPMYALDADGQLTFVNEAFVELTGYDRDRLIGSQPSVFTTQAAIDHAGSVIRSLLSSHADRDTFEFDVHTADGDQVPCECHVALLPFDDEFEGTVAVLRDITKRKRRQRELERQNELFGKAQEIATIGAYEYEIENEDLRWTEQVYEIHGLPTDFDPSIEAVAEIYHPDDRPKLREAINQAITTGEPYDLEVRISPQNNGTRWLRTVADPQIENGEAVRVRGTVHDITDRVEREQELRQYEHFFENSPDQIALLDEDFTVQYQSPPSSLHELDAIEIEGDEPLEYVHPDDRQTLSNHFEQLLRNPGDSFSEEFRAEDVSGEWRWVESRAINLLDQEPADGILVMIRDITQQKRQQLRLKRQNERLDEFASIISHDLQSPLSVAEGHLELAEATSESEHLTKASDAIKRSQALIDDLLTLAQQGDQVDETEPVDLAEVAETSWQTTETQQATLETSELQSIEADRSRLQQLLENLYRNAVEHGGEEITVRVGGMSDGFYVADTGPGIPESDRDEIFEAGYSTADHGTGIGLRIVEQIVEAHGWEISVTESAQGGARFEVTGVEKVD